MCGIAGRWGYNGGLHRNTLNYLHHRGPDSAGRKWFNTRSGPLELIHTRLAILDTSSAGQQPMSTSDGRYTLVLNGEIYNYRELRKKLEANCHFRSQTDTEVLLQAFAHWGSETFRQLDGMFALGVWDNAEETLTLARDPLGIKPLYISEDPATGLVFASELKALLIQPHIKKHLRVESVSEYLSFLWVPEPYTMFEDITKFPAGHYAVYRGGQRISLNRYFDLKARYENKLSICDTDAIQLTAETLREAIRGQMVCDVPLGAFFSGGLDSTAIVSEMAVNSNTPIITETIGFHSVDQKYDFTPNDLVFARQAVHQLPHNIAYHETILEEASLDLLPEVVGFLDDPIGDPAAISTFLITKAVHQHVTVMLSGMGAEELWGGYARYWATLSAVDHWGKVPHAIQGVARGMLKHFPSSRPGPFMGIVRQAKKYLKASGQSLPETFITFESYIDRDDLDQALMPAWRGSDPWTHHLTLFQQVADLDPLDQLAYVDAKTFLPSLNLAYTDRASMASSIEVRVPFLAHQLVDLAARLPSSMRLHGYQGKYVIKRAAEQMGIPPNIIWRKKSGFGAPVRSWMTRQTHPLIEDLLSPSVVRSRGILNPNYVDHLRHLQASGREDCALQLYSFMVLEQWFRTYVDSTTV